MPSRKPLHLLVVSSALSCLSVLVLAWPAPLHAEDPKADVEARNAEELPADATRIGDVVATSELVADAKTGRPYVKLIAMNTSQQDHAYAELALDVVRTENNPMSRVSAEPEVAWTGTYKLMLPPGARDERAIPLGAELAKAIDRAQKPQKEARTSDGFPPPVTSFGVMVRVPSGTAAADGEAAPADGSAPVQAG